METAIKGTGYVASVDQQILVLIVWMIWRRFVVDSLDDLAEVCRGYIWAFMDMQARAGVGMSSV